MGLDQDLHIIKSKKTMEQIRKEMEEIEMNPDITEEETEIQLEKYKEDLQMEDIATWRKHANLQGYCTRLWEKRGHNTDFNCEYLELFEEDIKDIIEHSKNHTLPYAIGFFWGRSDEIDDERTVEIMEKALKYIQLGYRVLYSSWW